MTEKQEDILLFKSRIDLRNWLEKNHQQEESIWIKFIKNDENALKHNQALEEALCFGWIDSQIKRIDDVFYKMKFSKRRKNSKWSEYNKKMVAKLVESGMMTIHGQREIDRAKENGNWIMQKQKTEFLNDAPLREKLSETSGILEKFEGLSHSTRKTMILYYNDAKSDKTRTKRLLKIVDHIINKKKLI